MSVAVDTGYKKQGFDSLTGKYNFFCIEVNYEQVLKHIMPYKFTIFSTLLSIGWSVV